ncbi:retrotransposon gag protein [Gossypium australe]|uniref:Retrotransposon gag protein n=1 Tax=Gossypium australe TaxID=47621 RepID=A0A5B6UVN8_9ROSI|nr:retrotransposon gag protein [Gossypium australe]
MDLETLYDAWERYKNLLRRCPHHGFPLWLQVQTFYNSVNPSTRQLIDSATGGNLNNRTPEAAYEFIEEMSLNNYQWTKPTKSAGVFNLDAVTMLSTQVEMMNKKLDSFTTQVELWRILSTHPTNRARERTDELYRSNNNPYSNNYNPGWRNHPNFSWGGQGNQKQQPPQIFQNQLYPQEKKPNLEEMLTKFMAATENHFKDTETNQRTSIEEIKSQVGELTKSIGQLAKLMSERPQGRLPSNTEINPKEQIQAITAHDSIGLDEPNSIQGNGVEEGNVEVTQEKPKLVIKEYQPHIPYPKAMKRDDTEEQFSKFLKLLKKLHINLPLLEALFQIPDSRKFLKQLLKNKRKLDKEPHVELNAVCSAMLQNRLPRKLKDPGSFTIPCLIGRLTVDNALADLGASINVIPYKMFKQLGLGKPKQTRMSIPLVDKTVKIPRGIIEDVLVKIDKFIFPVDFVVLDMDEDNSIPLILGRPFLATGRTKIDIDAGEIILCVGEETVTLQALDSARTSSNQGENVNFIDNHSVNPSFQETPQGYKPEPYHEPHANTERLHKELSIKIDKLEEWKMHFKEEPEPHEEKPKEPPEELIGTSNHFKIGDQVLLDKVDPRITTSNLNKNEEIPLEVQNTLLYGIVEISNPIFGTFKISKPHGLAHGRGRDCVEVLNLCTDIAEAVRNKSQLIFEITNPTTPPRAPTKCHVRAMRSWMTLT